MRLDHSKEVLDFNGTPIANGPRDKDGKVPALTFRDLVIAALNNPAPDENLGAEAKARCYQLSGKMFKGKHVNLTVDEAAFIKERAGLTLATPLVYGRLCDWLEGNDQKAANDEEGDFPEPFIKAVSE